MCGASVSLFAIRTCVLTKIVCKGGHLDGGECKFVSFVFDLATSVKCLLVGVHRENTIDNGAFSGGVDLCQTSSDTFANVVEMRCAASYYAAYRDDCGIREVACGLGSSINQFKSSRNNNLFELVCFKPIGFEGLANALG